MPFITEADLAALARYPLSLQQDARALWATAELRTPFGPAHRSAALIQRTRRNARYNYRPAPSTSGSCQAAPARRARPDFFGVEVDPLRIDRCTMGRGTCTER